MLPIAFISLLANLAAAQEVFNTDFNGGQFNTPSTTWATILADLQLKHETAKLEDQDSNQLIADCDQQLINDFPMHTVQTIEEFLELFKTQFATQSAMQSYFDNPGSKTLFIQTYDSLQDAYVNPDDVHFNCGIETLLASVKLHESLLHENGITELQLVRFDLNLLREELYKESQDPTSSTYASLQRLVGDLTISNQIYYFKKGKSFLYKGTPLVTEGAFVSLMLFKDHVDRFNMHRLTSSAEVEDFLDFSKPPTYQFFPLGSESGRVMVQEELYDSLPLKTRIMCPMPQQPDSLKQDNEGSKRDPSRSQSFNDFQNAEPPAPPNTLLNLSIPMIDSLHVEFALIEDYKVFREAQKKYWHEVEKRDESQRSPGGTSSGGCLVFIQGENGDRIKVDPERAAVDLQQPENLAMAMITAYQENGNVIPFGAGHTFQLAPLLALGSVHNPTILIPVTSKNKSQWTQHHEHLPFGYEFTFLLVEEPEELYAHLSELFQSTFDPKQAYLINDQLKVVPLGQLSGIQNLEHQLGLSRRNLGHQPLQSIFSQNADMVAQQQQQRMGGEGGVLNEVTAWENCGLRFPKDEYLLLAYSSESSPSPPQQRTAQTPFMPPTPLSTPAVSAYEATQAWTYPLMHSARIFEEHDIPLQVCKLDVAKDEIPEGLVQVPMKSFLGNLNTQIPQLFYMANDRQNVINVLSPMAPVMPPQSLSQLADFILSVSQAMSSGEKQKLKDAIEQDFNKQHEEQLEMMKQKWAHHGDEL